MCFPCSQLCGESAVTVELRCLVHLERRVLLRSSVDLTCNISLSNLSPARGQLTVYLKGYIPVKRAARDGEHFGAT